MNLYTELKTLSATNWSNKVYSLEAEYPATLYSLDIYPAPSCTYSQFMAWQNAKVISAGEFTNSIKALGTVPTVDIPVLVAVTDYGLMKKYNIAELGITPTETNGIHDGYSYKEFISPTDIAKIIETNVYDSSNNEHKLLLVSDTECRGWKDNPNVFILPYTYTFNNKTVYYSNISFAVGSQYDWWISVSKGNSNYIFNSPFTDNSEHAGYIQTNVIPLIAWQLQFGAYKGGI